MDAVGGHINQGLTEGRASDAAKEKNSNIPVQSVDIVIEQEGKQEATQEGKENKMETGKVAGKEGGAERALTQEERSTRRLKDRIVGRMMRRKGKRFLVTREARWRMDR